MPRRALIVSALLLAAFAWFESAVPARREETPRPPLAQASPATLANPAAAGPPGPSSALADPDASRRTDAPASEPFPGLVGEWVFPAARPVIEFARERARAEGPAPDLLAMPLRPGRIGTLRVRGFEATEEDGGVFTGELEGHPGSTVVLSYVGLAQSGVVLLPAEHRAFNYRAGDDGLLRVTELDTRHAPDCGQQTPLLPPRS